jgi:hypothetical protein
MIPAIPINYYKLSRNENLTWTMIKNNPTKNWHWYAISGHNNITLDIIEQYPNDSIAPGCPKWNHHTLTHNPNMTFEFIIKHPEIDWDWYHINQNIVTPEIFEEYQNIHELGFPKWSYRSFVTNKSFISSKYINDILKHSLFLTQYVPLEQLEKIIEEHKNHSVHDVFYFVSHNKNLTIDIIKKYPDENWVWPEISTFIALDIIEKYPNDSIKPGVPTWNFDSLVQNPNLTIEFVDKYETGSDFYWRWDYSKLMCHDNITMDILSTHKILCIFNQSAFIRNKNVTLDFINKNLRIITNTLDEYNKEIFYSHPLVTLDYMENIQSNWDLTGILLNPNLLPTTYNCYKTYKKYKYFPLVQGYENKIANIMDLLCDDLIGVVISFI